MCCTIKQTGIFVWKLYSPRCPIIFLSCFPNSTSADNINDCFSTLLESGLMSDCVAQNIDTICMHTQK